MENQAPEPQNYEDVQKSGYLRKHKSMHRRFFVLRAASEHGPARLEYYENEKKFRSKSPVPKKVLNLETCFNINKRADSKNKHMIVLYTRSESFAIAADSEEIQNEWYQAMLDLQGNCKTPEDYGSSGECSSPSPIPTFKEVWQVKVWPKGLGHARNLVGIYRLCLTDKTVNFVKLNSDVAAVVLQLMNVRRCGHSENFFFIEVGRSAITGPGEFWMQVDDSVVAQNMHETLLEAMKALSEEFGQRSKSQSVGTSCGGGTASNPISVPSRRHHPNLPPSQVGFTRRARTETPGTGGSTSTSPTSRHGFPRARTASIGASSPKAGADDEYMAMTPNNSVSPPQHILQPSSEGYMVMSPNSSSSTDLHRLGMWESRSSVESRAASDYMNISPVCSRSACSTPPSHPEQHQLQPKMFNSYFSLPRAYQHTLYSRFEEDLNKGEGKKESGLPDGAGRGGGAGYSKRNKFTAGSAGSCQLSMSSSSFSSSSASSESLEDKTLSAGRGLSILRTAEEYKSAGTSTKEGRHHQKCGSSVKSPKQQKRGRPLSVSSDITKANTLPRVKENLLPSQNVGEYVSIVFKDENAEGQCPGSKRGQPVIHGTLRPINQPLLCHENPANLPRSFSAPLSGSAEYVNMDVGKASAPLTPLSTFSSPQGSPAVASKARHERGPSSPLAAESSGGFRAKAKMAAKPTEAPPSYTEKKASDPSGSARAAKPLSMEQEAGLGFSPVKTFQSPERSGRLIRGDSQGRQGHYAETFSTPSSLAHHPSSSTSLFQEGSQAAGLRHGLDCSLHTAPPQASTSATEQGLNYIDLDLAIKESTQTGVERPSATYSIGGSAMGTGAGSSLNTYASIDFYKSEELRAQQSSRKEGQGKLNGNGAFLLNNGWIRSV
ncbi:unnamed protein product [Tetraodon nigroviridis]|uniref:(spotted green pufferfish) hypothetical protein n=1 Tax=Tetraodon nigroviridis TaxID=99883 RepID=Q4S8Y7_TETNG|nr:unnamed protein product [Tetraodon nigroviridis]